MNKDLHPPEHTPSQESIDSRHDRAFAFVQGGQTDDAIREYREILRLNPHDDAAHYNLANALKNKGLFDEAIPHFRQGLRGELGATAGGHYTFANALSQAGLLDEAIAQYTKALRLPQQLPDTHLKCHINLGLVFDQTGRFEAAIHEYRQALRLAPQSADAHCYLARSLQEIGKLDEAIVESREALRLHPDHELAALGLAHALAAKGLMDESVEVLKRLRG